MPRFDGTGPLGQGTMSGRGLGSCQAGLRRGFGFGFRRFYSAKNELASLEEEEKILKDELQVIAEEKKALADKK